MEDELLTISEVSKILKANVGFVLVSYTHLTLPTNSRV